MPKVKIIFNRSELGAGTRGSSMGPDAVLMASVTLGSSFFNKRDIIELEDENDDLFTAEETETPDALNIKSILKIYEKLIVEIGDQLKIDNDLPVILTGDHSNAGAYIAAIKSTYPDKRLGVIWIDAHADLHTPYTSPSGNMHGMPLAASLGIDNLQNRRNNVNELTADYWNKLKRAGGMSKKINPQDIVFIALRDTEKEERAFKKQYGIKSFKVNDVRKYGADQIATDALEHLAACDLIFISFDADCLDPKLISTGTGTPVKNGLSESEASRLVNALVRSPKLICLEFVEINPLLDNKGNEMAETTFRIMERAISIIESR